VAKARIPGREYYAKSGRIKPLPGAYSRRIASAERRGITSRTVARGHISAATLELFVNNNIPEGIDPNEYRAAMNAVIHNIGGDEKELRKVEEKLKKVAAIRKLDKNDPKKSERGLELWNSKEDWEPPEMYYYN
jgi:hypothetical protein